MASDSWPLTPSDIRLSYPQQPVTSTLVASRELDLFFGDNSTHGLPSPWNDQFKVLYVISAVDRKQYHYTFRALSCQDIAEVFESRLDVFDDTWYGVNNLINEPLDQKGIVFSAFRVLVDGQDESNSILERTDRVPEDQWRDGHPPPDRSGITKDNRWLRLQDLPQAKLEESLTAYVYIQASIDKDPQQSTSIRCSLMDWRILGGAAAVGIEKMLIRHSLNWAKENGFAKFEYRPQAYQSGTVDATNGKPVVEGDHISDIMVADFGFKMHSEDDLVVSRDLEDWNAREIPQIVVGWERS